MEKDTERFGRIIRIMHKYIIITHHLTNLRETETEPGPRSLQKVARWLGGVIRPLGPTPAVTEELNTGAQKWLMEGLNTLKNHYSLIGQECVEILQGLDLTDGERALEVGARWARRKLRNIKESTIRTASEEIRRLWLGVETHNEDLVARGEGSDTLQGAASPQTQQGHLITYEQVSGQELPRDVTGNSSEEDGPWLTLDRASSDSSPGITRKANISKKRKRLYEEDPTSTALMVEDQIATAPTARTGDVTWDGFRRYEHGNQKLRNWFFEPKRPIIIIGDSNMARLPRLTDPRVQIGCYQGARWLHACEIIKNKTPTTGFVTKVILSFGINDRSHDSAGLTINWMLKTLRAAEDTFPNAQVFVPIINFHNLLSVRPTTTLNRINAAIRDTHHFIEALPTGRFTTGMDHTHWTFSTGWAMWKHWRRCLNCKGRGTGPIGSQGR